MVLIVVSPDKLSLSMFVDFYNSVYCRNTKRIIRDLSCLYSIDIQEQTLRGIIEAFTDTVILIKYKIKPQTIVEKLPSSVLDLSDYTICFKELYSSHPILLRGDEYDPHINDVLRRWKLNIEKIDGQKKI